MVAARRRARPAAARRDLRERVRVRRPRRTATEDELLARADVVVAASDGRRARARPARARARAPAPCRSRRGCRVYEEVLGDGERGLLFEPGDVDTLAAQLERLGARPRAARAARATRRAAARAARAGRASPTRSRRSTPSSPRAGATPDGRPASCARGSPSAPLIDVDLHMHTDHSHDCATPVEVLLATARERGPRRDRRHRPQRDLRRARGAREGREYGVKVIVGEEVKTADQGEVIGLFIEEKIPRGLTLAGDDRRDQAPGRARLRPAPVRPHARGARLRAPAGVLDDVDAIEVFNPRVAIQAFNEEAVRFAAKYRIVGRRRLGRARRAGPRLGAHPDARLRRARGVPRVAARRRHHRASRPALLYVQALKFLQTQGDPARRAARPPAASSARSRRARRLERRKS